ncbi:MAG TPA: radical SAM protein [Candidatus Omnitrophota bacterium]|nr:B12-binding domain-containing radical SAM protein [Candidatus Omnitrophota bacterium]HNQ50384.1 radical SAM protein [Candidatus Omnitrophota bacterium]
MKPKVLLFNLPPLGGDLFPISLGYIAASLAGRNIDSVICEIDTVTSVTDRQIAAFILKFKPAVVGLAVYQVNIRLAVQLAKLVKKCDPSIVVVLGGPQATFMPIEALFQMSAVDVIIRGEGETVLPDLVNCLHQQGDITEVKGIAFRAEDGVYETEPRPFVRDLDEFPSPYQTGVFRWRDHTGAAMLTSRGCTFACGFCYTPSAFGRKIRVHSIRRVLDDMNACVSHGIRRFFFADPSFTFDKKRVRAIMRGIIRKRWKIEIWCETRSDLVDAPLLRLMAKAGVRFIAYGLESIDAEVNRALHKRVDLAQFAKTIRMTQAVGIEPEVFTLYGLPGQTRESALQTLRFLQGLGIKISRNSAGQQLFLFYGTDVFNNPRKYGIRVFETRKPLYLSTGADFETDRMTTKDIAFVARQYKKAERRLS